MDSDAGDILVGDLIQVKHDGARSELCAAIMTVLPVLIVNNGFVPVGLRRA